MYKGALALMIKEDLYVFESNSESSDLQPEIKRGVRAAVPEIINGIKEAFSGENRVTPSQEDGWTQMTQRKKLIREVVEERAGEHPVNRC